MRLKAKPFWAILLLVPAISVASGALRTQAVSAQSNAQGSETQDIFLGADEVDSTAFAVGRALCRLINRRSTALTCEALPTQGSVFNLENVRGGSIEFGLVGSEPQYHAVNQSGQFEFMDADYKTIRSLFSLYAEPMTVVARRDRDIDDLDDLKSRRVNLGNPGSRERILIDRLLDAKEWSRADFLLAEELPADQQSLAFCHDRVDAVVYKLEHPSDLVRRLAELCDGMVISVAGSEVDEVIAAHPYYVKAEVPVAAYHSESDARASFGPTLTLVASEELDQETVYLLVKAVFENLDELKAAHPVLGGLEVEAMISGGLTAPLHEGAARYYEESGHL